MLRFTVYVPYRPYCGGSLTFMWVLYRGPAGIPYACWLLPPPIFYRLPGGTPGSAYRGYESQDAAMRALAAARGVQR